MSLAEPVTVMRWKIDHEPNGADGRNRHSSTRPSLFDYIEAGGDLDETAGELFEAIKTGTISASIAQRHELRNVGEAHRELESRSTTGSTILTV